MLLSLVAAVMAAMMWLWFGLVQIEPGMMRWIVPFFAATAFAQLIVNGIAPTYVVRRKGG